MLIQAEEPCGRTMAATRIPTQAQRRFAQQLALGDSQPKAYAKAHPDQRMSMPALRTKAKRSANSPAVKGELARLLAEPLLQPLILEPCPAAAKPAMLREHAVATMLRLSRHSDPLVSFHAAQWLMDYANATDTRTAPAISREAILGELKGLYAKALNRPPIVEAVAEPESDRAHNADSDP